MTPPCPLLTRVSLMHMGSAPPCMQAALEPLTTLGFFAYPPEKVYCKLDSQGRAEGHAR
jgi:hypothetical protein